MGLFEQRPDEHPDAFRFGLDGFLGEQLREKGRDLTRAVRSAPQCWVLQGNIEDPCDLSYFRDALGAITAFLDAGGVAVFDPLTFTWWTSDEWRTEVFTEDFVATRHVVLMGSEDEDPGNLWLHTRGLLKFGRPDLSIPNVTPDLVPAVQNLFQRFVEYLALGAVVPRGEEIRLPSLPAGWRCFEQGSFEDPDFNNRHLYIGPPRLHHLTLNLHGIDFAPLIAAWQWLITEPLEPFAISYFGDVFFSRGNGSILMLDTVSGELRHLANSRPEFEEALSEPENVDEWFMPDLAFHALETGLELGPGLCFSWNVPPVLSGKLDRENISVASLMVHHHFNGQIHEQTKGLPEGTAISAVRVLDASSPTSSDTPLPRRR